MNEGEEEWISVLEFVNKMLVRGMTFLEKYFTLRKKSEQDEGLSDFYEKQ